MTTLARFLHGPRLIVAVGLALLGMGAVLITHLLDAPGEGGSAGSPKEAPRPAPQLRASSAPDQRETVVIEADARAVREVVLQVRQLDEWNPAFLSVAGPPVARVGQPHPIKVRGGLSGQFQYDLINADRVESSWQVPGLRETNYWELKPAGKHSTTVTHGFTQTGPLASLLRGGGGEVSELRLSRLKSRVESHG